MPRNLLFVSKVIVHAFVVSFYGHCTISSNNLLVARAPRKLRLWPLSAVTDTVNEATEFLVRIEKLTLRQWHEPLGHR